MPIVQVTLNKDHAETVRADLSHRLTSAVCSALGVTPEGVTVVVNKVAAPNTMGAEHRRQPGTPPSATQTACAFLAEMEARNIETASGYLAEGFTMIFPGGVCFSTLLELVAWAGKRYRFITKAYEGFDEVSDGDTQIVYCYGTLNGEWLNGDPFADIRFIDRFEVKGGLLRNQRVWNDLAESRK